MYSTLCGFMSCASFIFKHKYMIYKWKQTLDTRLHRDIKMSKHEEYDINQ